MKNWSIGTRIGLGLGALLALLLGVGAIGLWGQNTLSAQAMPELQRDARGEKLAAAAHIQSLMLRRFEKDYFLEHRLPREATGVLDQMAGRLWPPGRADEADGEGGDRGVHRTGTGDHAPAGRRVRQRFRAGPPTTGRRQPSELPGRKPRHQRIQGRHPPVRGGGGRPSQRGGHSDGRDLGDGRKCGVAGAVGDHLGDGVGAAGLRRLGLRAAPEHRPPHPERAGSGRGRGAR